MVTEQIKKIVLRLFPDLAAGYHLPRFARVVQIADPQPKGQIADNWRPYFAVDVEVLDSRGEPDPTFPILEAVQVSIPMAGDEMGFYALPHRGTIVEIAFAYGSPDQPFIRSVLPDKLVLPELPEDEQRWQHSDVSRFRVDAEGHWYLETDGDITHESLNQISTSQKRTEEYTTHQRTVKADDSELIGGTKKIHTAGAIDIATAGKMLVTAINDLDLVTDNDMNEKIANIKTSLAGVKQLLKVEDGGKVWLGSETENVLGILSELHAQVIQLCNVLAAHTHPDAGVINQGATVTAIGTATTAIKTRLDLITE